MDALEYIPRRELVDRLRDGWRLVNSHEYTLHDYAILMQPPPAVFQMDERRIRQIDAKFAPRRACASNRSQGATSRMIMRFRAPCGEF